MEQEHADYEDSADRSWVPSLKFLGEAFGIATLVIVTCAATVWGVVYLLTHLGPPD
jgi:hypothetical protein